MKILITTDWYTPAINGVVTSVLNLRKELMQRGHDVRVLTLSQNLRSYESEGITYIGSLNAGKIYPGARIKTAFHSKYIRKLIGWHPDVIHSQCEFSTFTMAKRIAKTLDIPIVHTYHTVYEDYTHYLFPSQKRGQQIVSLLSRHIINQCSSVIVPTEKVKTILTGYGIKKDIHVIPTGIDLSKLMVPPAEERICTIKAQLNIPEGHKILLYLGRLAKEKNLEEILKYHAKQCRKGLILVIAGDGPYRSALEQTAADLNLRDSVRFTGMIAPERVAEYYHIGDLFVNASTSETQGLTYIEALSSGLPALCRNDECLSSVILDGYNGWKYKTEEEFVKYLNLYLDDKELEQTMRANARDFAQKTFSASAFAEKVERIYRASMDEYSSEKGEYQLLS